ncbi:MAG TPA: FtsX-like permease family protein [Blastocatellia bacterium]|nr:FtsX-like permease family protein [Blastocatellia bacterium]
MESAYAVARRTRELGIRMALGVSRGKVVWLVLGEVAGMAGVGLAAGAVTALFLGKSVEAMLFGVKAKDASAFVVLAGVALVAGYAPARRAAGVDPIGFALRVTNLETALGRTWMPPASVVLRLSFNLETGRVVRSHSIENGRDKSPFCLLPLLRLSDPEIVTPARTLRSPGVFSQATLRLAF